MHLVSKRQTPDIYNPAEVSINHFATLPPPAVMNKKERWFFVKNGYKYGKKYTNRDTSIFWRCTTAGCKARLKTTSTHECLYTKEVAHNHAPTSKDRDGVIRAKGNKKLLFFLIWKMHISIRNYIAIYFFYARFKILN